MKNVLLFTVLSLLFACTKPKTVYVDKPIHDTTFLPRIDTPIVVTKSRLQGDTINFFLQNQNIEYPNKSEGLITFYLNAAGAITGNKVSIVACVAPGSKINVISLQQGAAINELLFTQSTSFILLLDITYLGNFNGDHLYKLDAKL